MGVHNLWELLAPVGRRVSVETLAGKKLAIDASIWMIQFMKAMRNEKGEMVKNAHILGFFRRICKLLFLRVKPVFVFDGATPALKRRTVAARRRRRDIDQTKVRKTAEKLLLNQIKTMRLQQLAENLKNQTQNNNVKGKRTMTDKADTAAHTSEGKESVSGSYNQEAIDEMLAASLAAEDNESQIHHASKSAAGVPYEEEDDEADEEMILPTMHGKMDPAVLATLPPSMQHDLLVQRREGLMAKYRQMHQTVEKPKTIRLQELTENLKNQRQNNDAKDKRKITDKADTGAHTSEGKKSVSGRYNQEAIDEMLAASLAAEDNESQMHHASTSAAGAPYEEEDDEADEEMVLPTVHGKMDLAVLAALPPSMQLDLLVQMRERLMAENRQKYQKVKKVPERFSELQIQPYLKTVAFRRDIDEVRKSAAGSGIGGVQTSRIASEANREFIFSSSFTGDKQVLAFAGLDQNSREQRQMPVAPSSNTSDVSVPTKKSSASGSVEDQSSNMIHNDVETYLDERGRVRVSRVRAMGLRMTRDLQRNLDLMKETEVESLNTAVNTSFADVSEEFPCKMQPLESSDQGDEEIAAHNRSEEFINSSTPIEVSFDVNGENRDDDDDLFTRLVAGDSDLGFCSEEELLKKQCSNSDSDCEWEEGVILDKSNVHHEVEVGSYPSTVQNRECHDINLEWEEGLLDGQMRASSCLSNYKETDMKADAGNDVEWEDGSSDIPGHAFSCQPIYKEVVSKGDMEEQINFQEAIKRSLEDAGCEKYIDVSSEDKKHIKGQEVDKEAMPSGSNHNVKHWVAPNVSAETVLQTIDSKVFGGAQRLNNVSKLDIPSTNDPPLIQSEPCTDVDSDDVALLVDRAGDNNQNIQPDIGQNCSGMYNAERERVKSVTPTEEKGGHLVETKVLCTSSQIGQVHSGNKGAPGISSHISDSVAPDVYLSIGNAQQFELKNPAVEHVTDAGEFTESFVGKSINNNTVQSLSKGDNDDVVKDVDNFIENSFMMDSSKEQVEKAKASLEEEMQRLGKERTILGKEHRKLERNAEAVSSEMYTECQELLQMFGLPYIIAPMEAEAQCAFMELENLVDGVVTDDSDVLLFGARSVYKNIFDDRKYVETYFMKDIENELGLTRDKLIRMALLLGSDYTEGVSGVGIVNAIEVINAFPEEDGLHKFREWIESPDPSILGKVDLPARSKLTKTAVKAKDCSKSSLNCSSEGAVSVSDKHGPVDDLHKMKQQFMDKHRKVSKNWHVPSNFPSEAVISEYDSPRVDKSTETFSWGKPDLFVLRKLCWEKFGWGIQKADELLVPVLKEYEKHETQLRMEAFYSFNERFAKIRSKRIEKAVKATMGNKSSELMDDTLQGNLKGKKKRKLSSSQAGSGEDVSISDGLVAGHVSKSKEAATANCSRKKRTLGEPFSPEGRNSESLMQAVERQNTHGGSKLKGRGRSRGNTNGGSKLKGRGRSRGISRGRGRGRSGKRGKLKESSTLEYAEISSSDENDNDSPQDEPDEKYDGSHQVRRSTRPRKAVKYATSDLDSDKSANASQDSGSSVDVGGKELLGNSGISTAFDACGSKLKHHELDPLLAETSSDNIQLGGEFCQDEAELNIGIDHVNLDQNGYTHSNVDEDYLRMGGGFCFEEDDVDNDTGKSAYSPRRNILHDNDNPSNCSVFMEDIESDIRYDASHSVSNSRSVGDIQAGEHTHKPYDMPNQGIPDVTNTVNKSHANVALSTNIVVGADPGARSGRFLSAMPNLRRKRKS